MTFADDSNKENLLTNEQEKIIESGEGTQSDVFNPDDLYVKNPRSDEDKRLGGSPPLKTIVTLSSGPLISQMASAFYGLINTIWISRAIGEMGMSAISAYQNFDTLGRCFASFLQVSATTKISSLYGSGQRQEASQVFSDLLRLTLIFGVIPPAIGIPTSYPCVKWFGASKDIAEMGYEYIIVILSQSIIPCIYLLCCGCLLAEGRSWMFSITQIAALALDCLLFCPLFLLVFKVGMAGAGYAIGLAELIPGLTLTILFYCGKFGIKPHPRDLLKKMSPHTWEALKLGFSQLILMLSFSIPGILIRKLFGIACNNDSTVFNNIMAAYNVFNRLWALEAAIPNAVDIGFIPAASYAYGAKLKRRIGRLLAHAIWITVIWSSLCMILTIAIPRQIAKIFSDDEDYLDWCEIVIRNGNLATCIIEVPAVATGLLQAMKKSGQSIAVSIFVQLLPLPIISVILFLTNKHDPARLIYCYPIQSVFGLFFVLPYMYFAIKEIKSASPDNTQPNNISKDGINANQEKELNDLETMNKISIDSSHENLNEKTETESNDKTGNPESQFIDPVEEHVNEL